MSFALADDGADRSTGSIPPRPPRASRTSVEAARRAGALRLALAMIAAVVVVAALAFFDEERVAEQALDEFGREQATLAMTAAAEVSARLDAARGGTAAPPNAPTPSPQQLVLRVARIESPGQTMLLVASPGVRTLTTTDGRAVESPPIREAFEQGRPVVRLDRDAAAALGLPPRVAVAGVAAVDAGERGRFGVVVVGSASRERDREAHGRIRLLASVLLAGGIVLFFGTIALRKQQKELELVHELEVSEAQHRRDDRLVRARRTAVLGALATGVADAIATPLAVIAGRADQLLARLDGDERAASGMRAILEQTGRIEQVLRGFLEVARGGPPTITRVAPDELAAGAVRLVEHRFAQAGVELAVDASPDVPAIACDVRLFEHALVTLLLRAAQASEPGNRVGLAVRAAGSRVAIVVRDEGAGTASPAPRPVEALFGEGAPPVQDVALLVVVEIVKIHHGTLAIEPDPRGGTIARVEVPAAPPEA